MTKGQKRTLIITRDISYPGGTEYFLFDYLLYLSDRIDPTNIYLLEVDGSGKFTNSDLEIKLKDKGVNILSIPDNISGLEFWDPIKLSYIDSLVTQVNPKVVHSLLFNADFIAYYLKTGKQVCEDSIDKTKDINKLHEFYPEAFSKLPNINKHHYEWISSKLSNFSVALEENTDRWAFRKDFTDNELEPLISRNTDVITVVSNEGLKKWANWTTKSPVLVPCSAVGENDLALIDKLTSTNQNRLGSTTRFICVSRLVAGKGIENVITSFKKVLELNRDIELYIVGDGELFDPIIAETEGLPQIKVVGFRPREEVFKMLAISDIFILASQSEGLPLSIQEAMAFGLPIIATNVGGIPDLVSSHENGILFNPGDIDGLSKSMLELSKSKDICRRMGRLSRKRLEKSFLKEKSYNILFNQYN